MLLQTPNFILSFGKPASENQGTVMMGQLLWSGNFKMDYEIDSYKNLRLIAINPFASEYSLQPNQVFRTLLYYTPYPIMGQEKRAEIFMIRPENADC